MTVALIKSSAAVTADPKLPIFSSHYDKGAKLLIRGAAAHNTTHERPDTPATRPALGGGHVLGANTWTFPGAQSDNMRRAFLRGDAANASRY